ncbi:hypothetical protein Ciccas_009299 [Cichlidogyrus casuarinus]|uniref:Uncharacterized protein n=1 Tax=Cichlidogyrus casuarinus TaxID=1844966 RepID=A0ABD2PZ61_9PLAT
MGNSGSTCENDVSFDRNDIILSTDVVDRINSSQIQARVSKTQQDAVSKSTDLVKEEPTSTFRRELDAIQEDYNHRINQLEHKVHTYLN